MTLTSGIHVVFQRYQTEIVEALRRAVERESINSLPSHATDLTPFYGQMRYHMGWVDHSFSPAAGKVGKLLRPTLLLLAYEVAGSWGLVSDDQGSTEHLNRALPAAASLELTHNFTLIHDDIVDGDTERHHQPTIWSVWGHSQGINTGDGMFALARLALWDVLNEGVEGEIAARLGAVLDRACLVIAEGQYLDLSFENRQDISVAMYEDMISRKTAALMSCASEMGAMLGTRDSAMIESLRRFGFEMGIAFQIRDDILGVWASTLELGKTSAGDIYRRKMSLPILHALEHASLSDQEFFRALYADENAPSSAQVELVLSLFERTRTREYCQSFLEHQCIRARAVLDSVPRLSDKAAMRAFEDLEMLLRFIWDTVRV